MRASARQGGAILWFTGLSGSGKSTLASSLGARLTPYVAVEVLDGDDMRKRLSVGLGFSREDRDANIRRIGFVARSLARHDVFVIAAAISPYAETRNEMRDLARAEGVPFIEVFLSAGLQSLIDRDTKGLYKRALAGEIPHFTGISDPYEIPTNPDGVVYTDRESVEASAQKILTILVDRKILPDAVLA
jgi:adenylylsulfate kinase